MDSETRKEFKGVKKEIKQLTDTVAESNRIAESRLTRLETKSEDYEKIVNGHEEEISSIWRCTSRLQREIGKTPVQLTAGIIIAGIGLIILLFKVIEGLWID